MKKKIIIVVLEILLLLGLGIFYTIKEVIPDLKRQYGSSDKVVNAKRYENMIEIIVDDNIDFSILLDKDEKIYHMFFLNKGSIILYNENIENNRLEDGVERIIKLLVENNSLNNNSKISVVSYGNKYYSNFINSFKNSLNRYSIDIEISEEKSTLIDLVYKLNIEGNGNMETVLFNLDYYSKEVKLSASSVNNDKTILNKTSSFTYSKSVYEKILKYINDNSINNLDKNNTLLVINMIPGDGKSSYYPTNNSWYYVKNKKIYAYIEFSEKGRKYGYCYKGSVDDVSEGECD